MTEMSLKKLKIQHTTFQGYLPFYYKEEDFKIYPCMGMAVILLCDHNPLNYVSFPCTAKVLI